LSVWRPKTARSLRRDWRTKVMTTLDELVEAEVSSPLA
jgi:hypothetical protein